MSGWFKRMLGGAADRPLFVTHRPEFQCPEWGVGQVVSHEGGFFRVTRWQELGRVPLARGGSVTEWQVWGRPVDGQELEDAVGAEAERILLEADVEDDGDLGRR
jgi:hypothetical protein